MKTKRYFIFQFAAYGDCLYATTIAKQIKNDEPDCHITWGISTKFKSILIGNPNVDEVLELDIDPKNANSNDFDLL